MTQAQFEKWMETMQRMPWCTGFRISTRYSIDGLNTPTKHYCALGSLAMSLDMGPYSREFEHWIGNEGTRSPPGRYTVFLNLAILNDNCMSKEEAISQVSKYAKAYLITGEDNV